MRKEGVQEIMEELGSTQLPRFEDFYDLSYEKGEIYLRGVKGRALVLPTKAWATLRVSLSKRYKVDVLPFTFHMGYAVGISFVEQTKKLEGKPKKLLKILLSMAKSSGWGHFSLGGDADNATELSVTAKNCAFCHNESLTESPVCHFLVGYAASLTDQLYGKHHWATETRCIGMGEETCEIAIREIHAEPEGRNSGGSQLG